MKVAILIAHTNRTNRRLQKAREQYQDKVQMNDERAIIS